MPRIDVEREILGSAPYPRLREKRILLAITGSVAAYKMVDLARELIRLGAVTTVMMTPDACKLITPMTFEWATGNSIITNITGDIEHVLLAGEHPDHVDLMVIAPATANTIGKIATGVADTNVSLTAMVAIGNLIPVLVIPGMHSPMFRNPVVQQNIQRLEELGRVRFVPPRLEQGKAKVPELDQMIKHIVRALTPQSLSGKHVLVTGGPTREFLDRVRFVSNPSSGKTGFALGYEAWYRGANVTLITGPREVAATPFSVAPVVSAAEMLERLQKHMNEVKSDIVVLSAAVADYQPKDFKDEKVRSNQESLSVEFVPTQKIIDYVKGISPNCFLVGFKAEHHPSATKIKEFFASYHSRAGIDLMVANDISEPGMGFASDKNHVWIVRRETIREYTGTKEQIAKEIFDEIES